jgi:hypothetical protein
MMAINPSLLGRAPAASEPLSLRERGWGEGTGTPRGV